MIRGLPGLTGIKQPAQGPSHGAKISHLKFHLRQLCLGFALDLGTRRPFRNPEIQQFGNFLQGETPSRSITSEGG